MATFLFVLFVLLTRRLLWKILADAMGLGKTIMTISLLLAHSERGGVSNSQLTRPSIEGDDGSMDQSLNPLKKAKITGFEKLLQQRNTLASGGNLIICPMTLLGQWKVFISVIQLTHIAYLNFHNFKLFHGSCLVRWLIVFENSFEWFLCLSGRDWSSCATWISVSTCSLWTN